MVVRLLVMLLIASTLGACRKSDKESASEWDPRIIKAGQDYVRHRLRDPESAVFTNMKVNNREVIPVVCGEVNARNGFGGMAGRERFIVGEKVGLESDFSPSEFETYWARECQ